MSYGPGYTNGGMNSVVSSLSFTATGTGGNTASATFSQTMTATHLVMDTAPLDFGEVPLGDTATGEVTLTNIAATAVEVDLTGLAATAPFARAAGVGDSVIIPAGAAVAIPVTARPTTVGTRSTWREKLPVVSVGTTISSQAVSPDLRVTGVARSAAISAEPVDFGQVAATSSTSQELRVANTGAVSVTVSAQSADPAVTVELPDTVIEPGATLTGSVTWSTATGRLADVIELTAVDQAPADLTAADDALATVPVTGEAIAATPEPTDPATEPAAPTPTVEPTSSPATSAVMTGQLARTGTRVAAIGVTAAVAFGVGALLLLLRRRARD